MAPPEPMVRREPRATTWPHGTSALDRYYLNFGLSSVLSPFRFSVNIKCTSVRDRRQWCGQPLSRTGQQPSPDQIEAPVAYPDRREFIRAAKGEPGPTFAVPITQQHPSVAFPVLVDTMVVPGSSQNR